MRNPIIGGTTVTPTPLVRVDNTYNPESDNPQSGKAVAEAIDLIDNGKDGVWWQGIPDNIILHYDGNGKYKDGMRSYSIAILKGNEVISADNISWLYETEYEDVVCSISQPTSTLAIVLFGVISVPNDFPKDRTNDAITIICEIDGNEYTRKIQVHYISDGENGASGIYIGSGEMPEGYNIQLDPDAVPDVDMVYNAESEKPQSGKAVAQAIEQALANFVNVAEVGQ